LTMVVARCGCSSSDWKMYAAQSTVDGQVERQGAATQPWVVSGPQVVPAAWAAKCSSPRSMSAKMGSRMVLAMPHHAESSMDSAR